MKRFFLFFALVCTFSSLASAYNLSGRLVDSTGVGMVGLNMKLYSSGNVFSVVSQKGGAFVFQDVTGIEQQETTEGFSVSDNFPNPFESATSVIVNMINDGSIVYDVFRVSGEKVYAGKKSGLTAGSNTVSLDLNGLPDGQYLLRISTDDKQSVTKKVIVKEGSPASFASGIQKQSYSDATNVYSSFLSAMDTYSATSAQRNKLDSLVITGDLIGKRVYVDIEDPVTANVDLGEINVDRVIKLDSEDIPGEYSPFDMLYIEGSGFDSTGTSVLLFDDAGYLANVKLFIYQKEGTATISLPPFMNASTGLEESGTVMMRVVSDLGKLSLASDVVSGITIGELPELQYPAGTVARNFYSFLELSAADEITRLVELEANSNSLINTSDLRSDLEKSRLLFAEMKNKISDAMANQYVSESVGTINGVSVTLNEENLKMVDRWFLGIINAIEPEEDASEAMFQSQRSISIVGNMESLTASNSNDYFGNIRNQEEYGIEEYQTHRQNMMAMSSAQVSMLAKYFAYGTLAVSATMLLTVGSVPLSVVALMTVPGVIFATTKLSMDATIFSTSYDKKAAAKEMLNSFNDFVLFVGNSFVSPIVGGFSEKGGLGYDTYMTFQDEINNSIKSVVSSIWAYIPIRTEPILYFGLLDGTQTEVSKYGTVNYTIAANVEITILGKGTVDRPYMGKITVSGKVDPVAIPNEGYQIIVRGGAFTLEGLVSGTQSNIAGSIGKYVSFTGGSVNGDVLTGKITFTVGGSWGTPEPLVKNIQMVKIDNKE